MKYVKMLGLAAITAALMAFAGSASATMLCKEAKTTGCAAAGMAYPSGTVFEMTLTTGTSAEYISGGFLENTCTGSTMKGTISSAGSSTETVILTPSSQTWANCSSPTTTTKLGRFEIHWISGTDNGTLTATGFEWTSLEPFGSCVYKSGTGNDLGTVKGGNPAAIAINTTITSSTGGFCATTMNWRAAYTFTGPKPLYVSES